jgi:hypothetical protein
MQTNSTGQEKGHASVQYYYATAYMKSGHRHVHNKNFIQAAAVSLNAEARLLQQQSLFSENLHNASQILRVGVNKLRHSAQTQL